MFRRLYDMRFLVFMLSVNNYIYKDKSLLPATKDESLHYIIMYSMSQYITLKFHLSLFPFYGTISILNAQKW